MARIMGIEIPGRKRVEYALRYIYGIGPMRARAIVQGVRLDAAKRADDLSDEELTAITNYLQTHYRIEGDLRRDIAQNIRRLVSVGSYRGLRHKRGLPVRGQRTSTNARTRKGPARTVGAVRGKEARSAAKKTAK